MNPLSVKLDQPALVAGDGQPPADHSAGILCLSSGDRRELLRNFLGSLRATNPTLPFRILSDSPQDQLMIWVNSLDRHRSRRIKTQLHLYTPYEITLYLDDDTYLAKSIDIVEMLGDADLAFAPDVLPTLADAASLARCSWHVSHQEVNATVGLCGASYPFYNSGVMVFRRNEATDRFFAAWNQEWEQYRRCDQFALARALCRQEVKVRCLAKSYNSQLLARNVFTRNLGLPFAHLPMIENYPMVNGTRRVPDAHIHHLLGKKPAAIEAGLWHPGAAGKIEKAYQKAVQHGQMSAGQYQSIARLLCTNFPCSLLMIGSGYDADLWFHCVRGNVTFVEDNPAYLGLIPTHQVFYRYPTKMNIWAESIETPAQLDHPWDYVIVDGPAGFKRECPGRQFPIAWAARLARRAVLVHDYNRAWERKLCDIYLGQPSTIIHAAGRRDKQLAVFMRFQVS